MKLKSINKMVVPWGNWKPGNDAKAPLLLHFHTPAQGWRLANLPGKRLPQLSRPCFGAALRPPPARHMPEKGFEGRLVKHKIEISAKGGN